MRYDQYWEAGGVRPTAQASYWDRDTFWVAVLFGAAMIVILSAPEIFSYLSKSMEGL
jgi:hypothetical protein